jgi:hypothetical protein
MEHRLYGSVCRISNLTDVDHEVKPRAIDRWQNGDYVVGRINERPSHEARIEAPEGRLIEPLEGEYVVGALGRRRATRGIVGDWEAIDDPSEPMHVIGGGGIIGQAKSVSPYLHSPIELSYEGHVHVDGESRNMADYVSLNDGPQFDTPVVLVLGTSMSSGKTMSARVIVRALTELGYEPWACKLSGSGRYHDIMSMKDAGAEAVFDFMDAGLPTTVVNEDRYRSATEQLLSHIEGESPDILVVEIGASPLEPYNGALAIERLQPNVVYSALTASDPYAVVGLLEAFDTPIDLVSGIATNTEAGRDLIQQLTDLKALNLQDESAKETLESHLRERLN